VISEEAIAARARRAGLVLPPPAVAALALHARAVLDADARLHLTAITDPEQFVERHVGESLEGAALLPEDARGVLLDLGSGNGYPGVPLALARPGLGVVLAEASRRKAEFLEQVARRLPGTVSVLATQVQRPDDLAEIGAEGLAYLATRAMGNWSRVVPRLLRTLLPGGLVLLWAGPEAEAVLRRAAWGPVQLVHRHPLAGRERSWIWVLQRSADVSVGATRKR
jgi:16S rRNA (guanine527-N7)-methyltransferase